MSQAPQSLTYRPDIDGLRAIAVVAVIFYHLQVLKLWGGFIGVDVFFVISGFLISSVIMREINESRFSLSAFYQRRIRRIFPALALMTACTIVAACVYLLPSELEEFAKSMLASSLSVSNFFFWWHSGYFDAASADQPLLHTWSLAVEEQFYIIFPLFLVGVQRYLPARLRTAILFFAGASFTLSVVGAYRFPTAAFYLPATRAWELLLGSILSLNILPRITSALWRNLAATVGLASIVIVCFTYDVSTPFPGLAALVPCMGAALIIAAGQSGSSVVGRLLSLKPVVFVGWISYSLYLWHWPIIVFQRLGMIGPPGASGRSVKAALLVLSFALATLSWKYVENPFRKGRLYLGPKAAFGFAGLVSLALIVGASAMLGLRGLPSRYSAEEIRVASYEKKPNLYQVGKCFLTSGNTAEDFAKTSCLQQDPSKKNYLLLGDSHAAQLAYGLSVVFKNINLLEATSSGCEPTVSFRVFDLQRCVVTMKYIFDDYLLHHHVDVVLLAARWEPGDMDRLDQTIEFFKARGIRVVLFGPIMQYDSSLPRLLAVSLKSNDTSLPSRHELVKYRLLDRKMAELAASTWKVPYVSYFAVLCPDSTCVDYAQHDVPVQFDYGHLTLEGSVLFAEKLKSLDSLALSH